MTASLILRTPCEHGEVESHIWFTTKARLVRDCPGGSEVVLDPEQVVVRWTTEIGSGGFAQKLTVQDIIDALTGEEG